MTPPFLQRGHPFWYYHGNKFSLVVLLDPLLRGRSWHTFFHFWCFCWICIWHYFPKFGEGKTHYLVTKEVRKKCSYKDRFPPISETTNSLCGNWDEYQNRQKVIGYLYLEVSPLPFWSKDQCKLSVTPSDSRIQKICNPRIFLWVSSKQTMWPSNNLSLIWAVWCSSRDLYQTPPVCQLFKPTEFGSRFSYGAKSQSSSERRIKLYICTPFSDGCWFTTSFVWDGCWFDDCSNPFKRTPVLNEALLVVIENWWLSSGVIELHFAFFYGG